MFNPLLSICGTNTGKQLVGKQKVDEYGNVHPNHRHEQTALSPRVSTRVLEKIDFNESFRALTLRTKAGLARCRYRAHRGGTHGGRKRGNSNTPAPSKATASQGSAGLLALKANASQRTMVVKSASKAIVSASTTTSVANPASRVNVP